MFVYSGWLDLLSVLCDHYQAYFSVLLRFSKITLTLSNLFPLLRHDPSGVSSKCYIWSLKAVWSGVARNNSQPFVTSDNSSALRWSLYSITLWSLTLYMNNLVFSIQGNTSFWSSFVDCFLLFRTLSHHLQLYPWTLTCVSST